jgi:hypothetical protein
MEGQKLTSNAASGHSAPSPGLAQRDLSNAHRVAAYPEFESAVAGPYLRLKSAPPIRAATLGERITLRVPIWKEPQTVTVLSDLPSLELFRTVWKSWPGSLDSDIDYFCGMLGSRGRDCQPHVFVLSRYGEPDAILVGFRERRRVPVKLGYRTLCHTQAEVLQFVSGALRGTASEENCAALVREVIGALDRCGADLAIWEDLDVESPLHQQAVRMPHPFLADHCKWQVDHWLMKFPRGLDDFLMSLERSQRSKLRRKYKKVFTHFDQRMEIRVVCSAAQLEDAIPHFEEIARKTEKRKQGYGFFDRPDIRQELMQAANNGWLRAFIVLLEGQPAAFWIGTLYNRVLQADYVGFDPAWGEFSPGIFLFLHVLETLQTEDIATIDFGRGDTQLQQCFSDIKRVEARVRIHAPTLRGLWLNLARTVAFRATILLRRVNGLSLSKRLNQYLGGEDQEPVQASLSRSAHHEHLFWGELEQVNTSL